MKKVNLGGNVSIYPMPVTVVGANVDSKPNFLAVAWICRVNGSPPLLAISLNKLHHTARGIRESQSFSVNFPGTNMAELVDYCGLVSGKETDKSNLFAVFYGELKTAPMIESCPLSLECKLTDVHELPTNDLFIGEIINSYADEACFSDGKLDIKKMNPLLLSMPDNRYWRVGDYVGDAWSMGKRMKGKEEKSQ